MRGLPDYALPSLELCLERNLEAARLTNPAVRCIGLAVNTSAMSPEDAARYLGETGDRLGLPAVDPLRDGVAAIVDRLD
jgi:uncharacterized NAD-dependent epimerase/dehydratase family protein